MKNKIIILILTILIFNTAGIATAAMPPSQQADGGTSYTVKPGDTLIGIALRYNLLLTDLIITNNIQNPALIFPGQQLILPGVPAPADTATPTPAFQTHTIQPGDTLFLIAQQYSVSIGAIIQANNLSNPDIIEVGQVIQIPTGPPPAPIPLDAPFKSVELSETTIIQGRTLVVNVTLSEPDVSLTGIFEGRQLFFNQSPTANFWTIIAIHALTEPGLYPINLTATRLDGSTVTATTNVTISAGPYGQENIQVDDSRGELLNADLIAQEREKLLGIWSQVSLQPRWEGPFRYPVDPASLRLTSDFGTRRSYNGSEVSSFHAGTDFGGGIGLPIYAPAAGIVSLAEPLTVRGNAVLLDHGLGLFSGYWHLSQIAVEPGQELQPGDLIGYLGNTGLVTGPHLHWEMRLQGIAVEPLQWVDQSIPNLTEPRGTQ